MNITIVKRGRKLQFHSSITLEGKKYSADIERLLAGGTKVGRERLAAFMEALDNGGEADDCFAAMRDHPEIDPEQELQTVTDEGKEALLAKVRAWLDTVTEQGRLAQQMLDGLAVEEVAVLSPTEGMGICSICLTEFPEHGIAGTDDLCMKHINPEYV